MACPLMGVSIITSSLGRGLSRGTLLLVLAFDPLLRLRWVEGWIESWRDEAMFSGGSGMGAEECAYLTALEVEHQSLQNQNVSVGSIDIYKCFDQIVRDFVEKYAKRRVCLSKF